MPMYIVALVTASSKEEADKIAQGLLEDKLAACVNIIPGVESYFWWQDKIDRAKEALLVIKTKKSFSINWSGKSSLCIVIASPRLSACRLFPEIKII